MAGLLNILRCGFRFGVFFVTNIYGLFTYMMWTTTLLPLRFLLPSVYWKIESLVFKGLQSFVIIWMGVGDYSVIESGDDIRKLSEEKTVLLCNHQSTADTPLVMLAMWPKGQCMANSVWIMDYIFRFTNFGLVSTMRRDFFIRQGKDTRHLQADMLSQHLSGLFELQGRKWIILFPEGGFLRKRIETSQKYAKKNGYPELKNVTLPRIGALKAVMDTLCPTETDIDNGNESPIGSYPTDTDVDNGNESPSVNSQTDTSTANGKESPSGNAPGAASPLKWMVDMTIGYRNNEGSPPDMLGMCVGYREKQSMNVHYRAYPMSAVPRESDGLLQWLYDRYEEKERLLEHFNIHGVFPEGEPSQTGGELAPLAPRKVTYDWVNISLYQVFYIVSTYFHYTCIIRPLWHLFF